MLVIFGSIPLALTILSVGLPVVGAVGQGRQDAAAKGDIDRAVGAAMFLAKEPQVAEMFDYEFRGQQLKVTWSEKKWLEMEREWNNAEAVRSLASILSRQ